MTTTATDPPSLPGFDKYRIPGLPPSAFYIPDFITPDEEALLLRKIEETPQPKWRTTSTGRRLQYWGGTLSGKNVLLPEEMPSWLCEFPDIIGRIDAFLDAAAGSRALGVNQVLVNEYAPGQGISPHEDGPAFRPLVATVSLGAHTVLDLYHYVSPTAPSPPMIAEGGVGRAVAAVPLGHVLLLPRSLFVLTGSLYSSHLHGIAAQSEDVVLSEEKLAAGDAKVSASAPYPPVAVANAKILGDTEIEEAIATRGWRAERGTRTSLTFRRAEKVLRGGAFALVGGKLKRG